MTNQDHNIIILLRPLPADKPAEALAKTGPAGESVHQLQPAPSSPQLNFITHYIEFCIKYPKTRMNYKPRPGLDKIPGELYFIIIKFIKYGYPLFFLIMKTTLFTRNNKF
jgi:hypothetical protein